MGLFKNGNYGISTLDSGISDSDVALTVVSGGNVFFPLEGIWTAVMWGASYASPYLDSAREIITMTLISGHDYTIVRAQENTPAKAWSAGDNVALVLTAAKLDELETYTQNNLLSYSAASGTNTYTATLDPVLVAYATGLMVNVKFTNGSTGASTLQVNGLAAKKIYTAATGSLVQCGSGDILAGVISSVFYDETLDGAAGGWILVSAMVSAVASPFASGTGMLFAQAAAPSGWTIDSSWGTPRSIVLGNSYTTAGTDDATTFTTTTTVDAHSAHTHTGPDHRHTGPSHTHTISVGNTALTVPQLPVHDHGISVETSGSGASTIVKTSGSGSTTTIDTNNAGSGDPHTHTGSSGGAGAGVTGYSGTGVTGSGGPTTHTMTQSTYSPRYIQVIRATKD